ncbi:MAG: sigma-70 family RNA polymerase sigma factor [Pseudomonadota bacterium]
MAADLISFPVTAPTAQRAADPDLAASAADGDTAAFEELVRRYQAVVRGMLTRLTGNMADADDVAQATFLKAWSKISTYGGGQFRSWICMIAYREFLQDVRQKKSRRDLIEKLTQEGQVTAIPGATGLPHDLDRALARLPDSQRIAVILCAGAGLSHSEVATATGWPLGTVKSNVLRGRSMLRELLEDYGAA